MKEVHLNLDYMSMAQLIELIDEPNRSICFKILNDNKDLFLAAPGSSFNHQVWEGGYIDHVTDGMNYARHLYAFDFSFGRSLPFSLSDVLLVFFLHDLEKPFKKESDLSTKQKKKQFRESMIEKYGIVMTPEQLNGLTYVEGEGDDYSSKGRVMNELAAFCHKVDSWCARGWHDYPKIVDEWTGAQRFRTF